MWEGEGDFKIYESTTSNYDTQELTPRAGINEPLIKELIYQLQFAWERNMHILHALQGMER